MWRAIRYGLDSRMIDLGSGYERPPGETIGASRSGRARSAPSSASTWPSRLVTALSASAS